MSKDIDIKEVIEDKNSWFNIKRFNIASIPIEKPEKTLDIKNVTKNTFERGSSDKKNLKIY